MRRHPAPEDGAPLLADGGGSAATASDPPAEPSSPHDAPLPPPSGSTPPGGPTRLGSLRAHHAAEGGTPPRTPRTPTDGATLQRGASLDHEPETVRLRR
jgi:hypothetical protein